MIWQYGWFLFIRLAHQTAGRGREPFCEEKKRFLLVLADVIL
jgi:hypothetical protein